MSENNTIGLGATLQVNDGSGTTTSAFALLLDLVDIDAPDPTVGTVESKRLNLTNRVIRKLAGLKDGGDLTFTYEYSKGKKDRLDLLIGGQDRQWKITLPDTGDGAYTKTIPGFLSNNKIQPVMPDGLILVKATVVVSDAQS